MGRIYLDERNSVRFDETLDGTMATQASWNREILAMLTLLTLMNEKAEELCALTGRTPLDPRYCAEIKAMEAEVWQRSIATTVPLE